jgi:hypothetical protein
MDRSSLVARTVFVDDARTVFEEARTSSGEDDKASLVRKAGLRYSVFEVVHMGMALAVHVAFSLWVKLPWRKSLLPTLFIPGLFVLGVPLLSHLRVFAVLLHRQQTAAYVRRLGGRMRVLMMVQLFVWLKCVLRACSLRTPVITNAVVQPWFEAACAAIDVPRMIAANCTEDAAADGGAAFSPTSRRVWRCATDATYAPYRSAYDACEAVGAYESVDVQLELYTRPPVVEHSGASSQLVTAEAEPLACMPLLIQAASPVLHRRLDWRLHSRDGLTGRVG